MSQTQHTNCLIYGESGIGKTVLCATCKKPLVISAENGLLSLRAKNLLKLYPEDAIVKANAGDIAVYHIDQVSPNETNEQLIWRPFTQLTELLNYLKSNQNTFETVIFDSLSEVSEILISSIAGIKKDKRLAFMEIKDRMSNLIRCFNELPIDVVYLCKCEDKTNTEGNIGKVSLSMPGKQLASSLPYLVDEVFYYKQVVNAEGKKGRVLCTQEDSDFCNYVAKDRSGVLNIYELPHLGNIFAKIKGV